MLNKHPLFWKEWKSAKWWCLLIIGIFLIMFLAVNNELQHTHNWILKGATNGDGRYSLDFVIFEESFADAMVSASLAFMPIIIVIVTILFQDDRKESIGAFVSSLPFTKKEQFKVKWSVGMLTITIPFVIAAILAIFMRSVNWGWIKGYYDISATGSQIITHDTLAAVILVLLQTYLFFMAFYSFLMFMQTLIPKNIVASVIGVLTLASPFFIIEMGRTTLSRMMNNPFRFNWHSDWSLFYSLIFMPRNYLQMKNLKGYTISVGVFSYGQFWFKTAVLVVIAGLSLYAGIKCYGRNENSRNGQLIMFDWAGNMLIIGVTISAALLGNNALRVLFINQTKPLYELITLTISAVIGFVLIKKIVNQSGRCKA